MAGLGAQKATKNFADIEKEAELADNIASTRREEIVQTAEEKEAAMVSMRLAYQDLEVQQKKKEQAMSRMDPKKAQQMERLGMGFGSGAGQTTGFGSTKSHSLMSDSGVIVQEEPNAAKKAQYHSNTKDNFFDDFEVLTMTRVVSLLLTLIPPRWWRRKILAGEAPSPDWTTSAPRATTAAASRPGSRT